MPNFDHKYIIKLWLRFWKESKTYEFIRSYYNIYLIWI